ncbi:MAG TPA: response regulator [Polyangiaceae bacterium]|nr:response regulator [Polyangiaceae bacterium]
MVDDEAALLAAYSRALAARGYRVEAADDAETALAALNRLSFDVILSDLDLPGIDGIELISRVRERDLDVPVVVITGNPSLETATEAMERGAMRYLVKPIEIEALVRVANDALRVHREAMARRHADELLRKALALKESAEQRARGAEQAQEALTGTLDAVMECAPAFIIAVDRAGRIQFINKVLDAFTMEEVIGSDFLLYMPPADHDAQRARLRRVVETGVAETYETSVGVAGEDTRWFSAHMGPMRVHGEIVGAVLVSQDITELKRTQADFVAAQRLAAVGTLAAGIAHEINTPIQFVNDSVHFLRDAAKDVAVLLDRLTSLRRLVSSGASAEELREALEAATVAEEDADLDYLRERMPAAFERCVDGLERVTNIVRSMKEFAHPAQHDMAHVDLNRAVSNTLTIARNEYKYVADLETDFAEIPPVKCHVNDINQVVLNLVVNAAHAIDDVVKGTEQKGRIRVTTRADGDDVVIAVADTGKGIPDAIAHRIFEPFFTTKEVGKGTGQGLALAWAVVKGKHGGDLRFSSKVGEGTTFFVRLPVNGREQPAPEVRQ